MLLLFSWNAVWFLVSGFVCAIAEPWNLPSYSLCKHSILDGIPSEASGVTYSEVTNSLYVITRRPRAVVEYGIDGRKLRAISHRGLRDPEGITWMYGYTFAVAQEGGSTARITIMDLVPWRRSAVIRSTLVMDNVKCKSNSCFEGITYDVKTNAFFVVQEEEPMKLWRVTTSGVATPVFDQHVKFPNMRDLAGAYLPPSRNGIFLLSQTEQRVSFFTWAGNVPDGQSISVRDNMVEGLTFTPDGVLMITVGEPNDLWIYTSTGQCTDWAPPPGMKRGPSQLVINAQGTVHTPPDGADPDGGYCNWSGCTGDLQGSYWCNSGPEPCVAGCGGTWCWWSNVGKPLTKDDLSADAGASSPPPSQSNPPPYTEPATPSPTPGAEDTGYCNWSGCTGGRQGSDWCNLSPQNCVAGCGGTFCWDDPLMAPLTAEDFLPPAAPQETGEFAGRATAKPPEALSHNAGDEGSTAEVAAASARKPNLTAGKQVVEIRDRSFGDGFLALVTVIIHGIFPSQFTPLEQLHFREAMAAAAYGSQDGFLEVVFNSSAVDERNAVFSGILSIGGDASAKDRVDEFLDAMGGGRRLLQRGAQGGVPVTVRLLGETDTHAWHLANRTRDAILSGQVAEAMGARGSELEPVIEMVSASVIGSDVAPQYYPVMDSEDLPEVHYSSNYTEINVRFLSGEATAEDDNRADGSPVPLPVLVGSALGGAAVLAGLVGAALLYRRRSHSQEPGSPSPPTAASRRSASRRRSSYLGTNCQVGSGSFTFSSVIAAASNIQMGSRPDGESGNAKGDADSKHRRTPSDLMSIEGLLNHEDAFTPTDTPSHSRQSSMADQSQKSARIGCGDATGPVRHGHTRSNVQLLENFEEEDEANEV